MADELVTQSLGPKHLRTLYEITGTMNSSLDFDEVLNNVMDSVMHVTKAQRGFLMIADETGELRTLVIKGVDGATLDAEGYSTTIVREVVRTRKPLLTNNAQFDTRYKPGQRNPPARVDSAVLRGLLQTATMFQVGSSPTIIPAGDWERSRG